MINFETLKTIQPKKINEYFNGDIVWSFDLGYLYTVEADSTYYGRTVAKVRDKNGNTYSIYTSWKIGNSIDVNTLIPIDLKITHIESLNKMSIELVNLIKKYKLKKYHKIFINILNNINEEKNKRNSSK